MPGALGRHVSRRMMFVEPAGKDALEADDWGSIAGQADSDNNQAFLVSGAPIFRLVFY